MTSEVVVAVRILAFVAVIAALVVIGFATGWADDKAPPGSRGGTTARHRGARSA